MRKKIVGYMQKKSEILSILKINLQDISKKYFVDEIGLFGSFATNSATAKSDIDILVTFTEAISIFDYIELEDYLTGLLHQNVDLVTKKGLKQGIKNRILRNVIYV